MKNASAALIAYLNSLSPTVQPYVADLLTIVLANGTIVRMTSAPENVRSTSQAISPSDVTVYTFSTGSPTFLAGQLAAVIGLEVSDLSLVIMTDPATDTLGGVAWPAAARAGALDGATITLERAFMPTWGDTSKGTLIRFKGTPGQVEANRNAVAITVKANIAILASPMPRNVYGITCWHQLYDSGCTLAKAGLTVAGTVAAGATTSVIPTNLAAADAFYEQGVITITSGALSGLFRIVKTFAHTSGVVTVGVPFPSIPANGVTFTIYPGCDKTQATCSGKFGNLAHFAGYPYIPTPESAA